MIKINLKLWNKILEIIKKDIAKILNLKLE